MGQSDTESTTSSMRGNPGSPRDPSFLLEEVALDTGATPFSRAAASSPSTSSDGSELDTSVIITGERPKSRQRDIPFIDLTSPDQSEPGTAVMDEANSSQSNESIQDVTGMYNEFAARVQRQLHAARERVARMRAEHHRLRLHALRSRMQNCPYIATYRDGRRQVSLSSSARQRPHDLAVGEVAAASSSRSSGMMPIAMSDSSVAGSSSQNNHPAASADVQDDSIEGTLDGSEAYEHHPYGPEHRYTWRRRLSREALQRIQDRVGSCIQDSDETIARRLQAQFDQEFADEQQQPLTGDSSYLAHATPDLAAGPMPSPLHFRRRRNWYRRHNVAPHFAPASGLPDLLLPFVSVTSLPPPLHHFGDPGQNQPTENEDYEVLWNLSERLGPAKSRGLSKEVIDRIPSFRYSASNKGLSNGSCVVCMMDYTNREKLRKLPCTHDFHSKCIDRWLKNNRSCPICRETVTNS